MRTIYITEQADIQEKYDDFGALAYDVVDKAEDVIYGMEDYDIYADQSVGNYEDNESFIKETARDVSNKLEYTIKELQELKDRIDKRIKATAHEAWN